MQLEQRVRLVMQEHADRPAIAERRPLSISGDPARVPEYTETTYQQLWAEAEAIAAALYFERDCSIACQDRIAFLSFTSGAYARLDLACIRLGAVSVHLQTSAVTEQLADILAETQCCALAVSHEYLDTALDLLSHDNNLTTLILLDHNGLDPTHQQHLTQVEIALEIAFPAITLVRLDTLIQYGRPQRSSLPETEQDEEALSMLIYTSGSTGTPKGAMYTNKLAANMWGGHWSELFSDQATSTFHYMPMSHVAGHSSLKNTFSRGGLCYFASQSNLASFFDDIRLARPTELSLVPRVCEMIHQKYLSELRVKQRTEEGTVSQYKQRLRHEFQTQVFGGQVHWIGCGSAPLSEQMIAFIEWLFELELNIIYGSTEAGAVAVSERLLMPPVSDYKLVDAPELGYSKRDTPYPRGELLLKTASVIPGYFNHPVLSQALFSEDGYYKTGDIFEDLGQGKVRYVDRRSNVLKLSQGEFVTTAKLEAIYVASPLVRQIYVYGDSQRSSLLAVVVPTASLMDKYAHQMRTLERLIMESLRGIAKENALQRYEIPRGVLIEPQPFTNANGLLSDHGKALLPRLRAKYQPQLEALYDAMSHREWALLNALPQHRSDLSTEEAILTIISGLLGSDSNTIESGDTFRDLGGDSLSAVTLATLLEEVFEVRVPIDVLISPANDIQSLVAYVETARRQGGRVSFEEVHGHGVTEVYASQLTLANFIDPEILHQVPKMSHLTEGKIVLLTGASGYLGRFVLVELLERAAQVGGKVIAVVRAKNHREALKRVRQSYAEPDADFAHHLEALFNSHLEVVSGDLSQPQFGLDTEHWQELASNVDTIVHAGALVNHVLPYRDCFEANVFGTAEVIRLALERKMKPLSFLSSIAVADRGGGGRLTAG
ncbi:AMP-binding protein [Vibrio ouci]|nr:AMP-binding protein [Vibrio ouci]